MSLNRENIRRGSIFIANLDPTLGAEKGKKRRVLIVSNDIGNSNPRSPVVIVVPITGSITEKKKKMPMYVEAKKTKENGLTKNSLVDCFQIRVLDIEERLEEYIGYLPEEIMKQVDMSIETCLQLKTCPRCKHVLLPNKKHCVSCKHILVKVCKSCFSEFDSDFNFCPHCGQEGGDSHE